MRAPSTILILTLVVMFSSAASPAAQSFSDSCSELIEQIRRQYWAEQELPREAKARAVPSDVVARTRSLLQNRTRQLLNQAKDAACNIPDKASLLQVPPRSEDTPSAAELSTTSSTSSTAPAKFNMNSLSEPYLALFPQLQFRKWNFVRNPDKSSAGGSESYDFTVIAITSKKVRIDGVDYPPGLELFIHGNTIDLASKSPGESVFRKVRLFGKAH